MSHISYPYPWIHPTIRHRRDEHKLLSYQNLSLRITVSAKIFVVGPLSRVRPRNGILGLVLVLVLVLPLRSEFIAEL